MRQLKTLVIDDEPLARRRLQYGLESVDGIEAVREASDGREALEILEEWPADVLLLDIKMPRLDGFAFLDALADRDNVPAVIFVTAFDNYAVNAFEHDAIDYLLKPVKFSRLGEAIDRARLRLEQMSAMERARGLQASLQALQNSSNEETRSAQADFWIKDRDIITRVSAANIVWIEAERDYVRLHLDGRSYLMRSTLMAVEGKLPEEDFLRVHRSAIVNRQQINSLSHSGTGAYTLHLVTGDSVPVGRSYKKQILAEIDDTKKPGRG